MQLAIPLVLALAVGQAPRSCYETANFRVVADSAETAKKIGDAAETYRRELAKRWHGEELADWSAPCRIDFTPSERAGGVTEITYDRRRVLFQRVSIQGPLERVLKGPLPHELTHVLFAHHFGQKPPAWVDEGGAILGEGDPQKAAHERVMRQICDKRGHYSLRELFGFREYPSDVPRLYAQGHSVSGFLVAAKGHQTFLAFVRDGMQGSWDDAVKERYGYQDLDELEKAWLGWFQKQTEALPAPKSAPPAGSSMLRRSSLDFAHLSIRVNQSPSFGAGPGASGPM